MCKHADDGTIDASSLPSHFIPEDQLRFELVALLQDFHRRTPHVCAESITRDLLSAIADNSFTSGRDAGLPDWPKVWAEPEKGIS